MQPITHLAYLIEPYGTSWAVSYAGRRCDQHRSRRAALCAAVANARHVRERGCDIRVLVRRPDGSCRSLPERLLRPPPA